MPQMGEREQQLKQQALDMGADLDTVETISPMSTSDYGVPAKAVTEAEIGYSEDDFSDLEAQDDYSDLSYPPIVVEPEAPTLSEADINSKATPAALVAASYGDDTDVVNTYRSIVEEYVTTGKSPTYDRIKDNVDTEAAFDKIQAIEAMITSPEASYMDVEAALNEFKKFELTRGQVDMQAEAALALGAQALVELQLDEEGRKIQEFMNSRLATMASPTQHLKELKAKGMLELNKGPVRTFIDTFVDVITPFVGNFQTDDLVEHLQEKGYELDSAPFGLDFLLPGTGKQSIRDKLMELDYIERDSMVREIIKFLTENNDGIFIGNSSQNMMLLQDLLGSTVGEATLDDDKFGVILDNLGGVLDAGLSTVSGLVTLGRVGRRMSPSLIRSTLSANPRVENEVVTSALKGSGDEVARAFNTDKEDLMKTYVLAKPSSEALEAIPAGVARGIEDAINDVESTYVDFLKDTESLPRFLEEVETNPGLLFEEKYSQFSSAVVDDEFGAKYNQAMSTYSFNPETNQVDLLATFSRDAERGFATPASAIERAKQVLPQHMLKDLKILERNDTGSVGRAKIRSMDQEGEYFFAVEQSRNVTPEEVDMTALFNADVKTLPPKIQRLISDPDVYTRFSAARANYGLDKSFGQLHTLQRMWEKHFVRDLSFDEQVNVNKVLAAGDEQGKIFDAPTLASEFQLSPAEMRAYYAAQAASRMHHAIDDATLVAELRSKNMRHISIEDGELQFEIFARPKELANAKSVEYAYDPLVGSVIKLTPADVEKYYNAGGFLAKANHYSEAGKDGKMATHVLVRKTDEGKAYDVKDVPGVGALKYNEGQITRYYKENVFVTKTVKVTVDGKPQEITKAVGAGMTKGDAEKILARYTKDNPKGNFEIRFARELSEQEFSRYSRDLSPRGGPRFGKRNTRLTSADERQAEIASPLDSLIKTSTSMVGQRTMGKLAEVEKQRWVNTFGKFSKEKDEVGNPMFPSSEGSINKDLIDGDKNAAITQYRYILNNLEGFSDNREWQKTMINIASMFEKNGSNWFSRFLVDKVGQHGNPFSVARSVAFKALIAANPLRQALLQSQQFTLIAGANPILAAKSVPQAMLLSTGILRNRGGWFQKAVDGITPDQLKKAGFGSVEEYEDAVKAFEKSGLPYSINGNSMVRENLRAIDTHMKTGKPGVAETVGKVAGAPLRAVQTVGFNFGEFNNLALTWSFARQKFIKANGRPPKFDTEWAKVTQDARELSMSMTRVGETSYQQHGALSVLTQFMSAQHKAWLIPFKANSLSKAERGRVALAQFILYGAAGYGLDELASQALDSAGVEWTDDEKSVYKDALVYGAGQTVLNGILSSVTGEEQQVDFTSLSATAGMRESIMNMTWGMLTGVNPMYKAFPAASVAGKFVDGAQWFKTNLAAGESDPIEYVKILSTLTSGGAQYLKADAAQRFGYAVSARGDMIVEQTELESSFQKWFGLGSQRVSGYYEFSNKGVNSQAIESAHQDVAKEIFDKMKRTVVLLEESNPETLNRQMFDKAMKWLPTLMGGMNPNDRAEIERRVFALLEKDHTEVKTHSLFEKLMDNIYENNYGTDYAKIVDKIGKSKIAVKPEHVELLKSIHEDWTNYVKLPSGEEK